MSRRPDVTVTQLRYFVTGQIAPQIPEPVYPVRL